MTLKVARRLSLKEILDAERARQNEPEEAIVPVKARIMEMLLPKPAAEPELARCSERGPDGRQCEAPSMSTRGKCARHLRWSEIYPTALPFPQDGLGLQEMLGYAVVCAIDKTISPEQAHAIAELGRVMQKNLEQCRRERDEMAPRR